MRPNLITALSRLTSALVFGIVLAAPVAVAAQSLFEPVVSVNESVVTAYELDQRMRMLEMFRTPGDLSEVAREQLIEDRLKMAELQRAGLVLSEDGLQTAMEQFAERANLTLPAFLQALQQNGVSEETLRDFVEVGQTWRDYVRSRYGSRVQITDAEVDAALGQNSPDAEGIEVLLTEIIIAAPPPQAVQAMATARQISQLTSTAAFEAQARRVSALPSRGNGGRLGWLPITNYPPQLRALLLSLSPGEVTQPIPITNGVALFQMRGVREVPVASESPAQIEYAAFYIPGGLSAEGQQEAANVAARVDACDDLYGVAHGLPEDRLVRETLAPDEIEQDIAMELAKLDPGETSAIVTRNEGQTLVFLMLCNRVMAAEEDVDREAVENRLRSRRLNGYANALLADLRASATILNH